MSTFFLQAFLPFRLGCDNWDGAPMDDRVTFVVLEDFSFPIVERSVTLRYIFKEELEKAEGR